MRINASCPEHTPAGDFLGMLYYGTRIFDLLTHDEYRGFPNNGCEHTLVLSMPTPDIDAFLDLIQERFNNRCGCLEFVTRIRSKMQPAL